MFQLKFSCFVKQVNKLFETKTGLFIPANPNASKKKKGEDPSSLRQPENYLRFQIWTSPVFRPSLWLALPYSKSFNFFRNFTNDLESLKKRGKNDLQQILHFILFVYKNMLRTQIITK